MSRSHPSISSQIDEMLRSWTANGIKEGRHVTKQRLDTAGETISSRNVAMRAPLKPETVAKYRGEYKQLCQYCRDNGLSLHPGAKWFDLSELRPEHVSKYIEHRCADALAKQGTGMSAKSMNNIISCCNKLDAMLPQMQGQIKTLTDVIRRTFVPQLRQVAPTVRRFNSPEAVIAHLSGNSRIVADIQLHCGLRVTNARSFTINQDGTISFISKGGQPHPNYRLPVDLYYKVLDANGGQCGHVELVPYRTYLHHLQAACKAAGEEYSGKSSHGFRHNYAYNRYHELRAEGMSDKRARAVVSEELFHKRLDVVNIYIDR